MGKDLGNDHLHAMRHSLAHIMAASLQQLWPEAKFGVGPVIDEGFYYDVDLGAAVTPEDLPKIEAKMQELIKANLPFERFELGIDEAIEWAKRHNQPYKQELLEDLKSKGTTAVKDLSEELGIENPVSSLANSAEVTPATKAEQSPVSVTFYRTGEFEDLCRGPHVESTGKVGHFKLHKISGAYWRGDEKNPQLQRIYGAAFETKEEVDRYFERLEEAIKRDHRKLGQELNLFTISELVGSGLPLFTTKGTWLRELLSRYAQQLRQKQGFERVWTPHITKNDLYKKSGHWDKFGDELFLVKSQETTDEFVLKPMNCPHHIQIYAAEPHSYKDLPLKFMENTTDYRDEKSGELLGLARVRAFTQDDSHVFCTEEQIQEVATDLVAAAQEMYKELKMELKIGLSFRNESDAYLGDAKLWEQAQATLEQVAKSNNLDYFIDEGEAAFYGPKIDFIAVDVLGREWQLATVQLDFVQPARFGLEYIDSDNSTKTPVMIHCALLGSIERFLSIYIEHTAGNFPFWLAPEQVRILTINDAVLPYVEKVKEVLAETVLMQPLKYNELRFELDDRNESLGKKIREAEVQKVPVMLIVGPKDEQAGEVSVRTKEGEQKVKLEKLQDYLVELS